MWITAQVLRSFYFFIKHHSNIFCYYWYVLIVINMFVYAQIRRDNISTYKL